MADNTSPLPSNRPFNPHMLDKSVIAMPLLALLAAAEREQRWYERLQKFRQENQSRWAELVAAFGERRTGRPSSRTRREQSWQLEDFLDDAQHAGLGPDTAAEEAAWLEWLEKLLASPTQTIEPRLFSVIIDLNLQHPEGRKGAKDWVLNALKVLVPKHTKLLAHQEQGLSANADPKNRHVQQYLFVRLEADVIRALVVRDTHDATAAAKKEAARQESEAIDATTGKPAASPDKPFPIKRAMYRIWPDFPINGLVNKSISTVKADAAQVSYAASGEGMVWAVLDSGVAEHRHFDKHQNLKLAPPLQHTDFTTAGSNAGALRDGLGHGTHVAGIIAGELRDPTPKIKAFSRQRDGAGDVDYAPVAISHISGIAPKCKILSLKVMDDNGQGEASNLIAAIALIQEINGYGRNLLVQGVNMSVGYSFEPEWFACGQSPLCVEVNRLVRSGVVVVVAAGNTGYGAVASEFNGQISTGMSQTINDPGNADLAITVGSTHRDMPHVYGVSYFSSKGPTGDGRPKPDLVAPGEKILSCAAGTHKKEMEAKVDACDYLEQSGTSMAAPHVSGAVAAFLSIRREFIGYPEKVKEIFVNSATDLKRERYFQGAGLVDLMRAIQSV
jgi:serine protease AprX